MRQNGLLLHYLRLPSFFLVVATPHIPSTARDIAGATVSPVVPTNKIHAANARQIIQVDYRENDGSIEERVYAVDTK